MRKLKPAVATTFAQLLYVSSLEGQARKTTSNPETASVPRKAYADPQKIRAHVKFLSSDQLEGRGTGQPGGDLAADYIAKQFAAYGLKPHSPVPPGKISLDLNYDALAPIGDPEEVEVSGAERTTFFSALEEKAKAFGLAIRPDAHPEAGYDYRSDHFSLARVGIPSFSIAEGLNFKGHDAPWGEAQMRDYLEHRYHQPADEYWPEMDFTGDAKLAMLGYELGMQAASQLNLVNWLPGDEFEAERRQSQLLYRKPPPPRKGKPHKSVSHGIAAAAQADY